MKGQKIIAKFLFLLALFFLSLILFFVIGDNGMDDAAESVEEKAGQSSLSLTPRTDSTGAGMSAMEPNSESSSSAETPSALRLRQGINVDAFSLLAVFEAHSPLASAVIDIEGHGAHRYRVGDELTEGAFLGAIQPTAVIIYDSGKRIMLHMRLMSSRGSTDVATTHKEASMRDDRPKMPWQVVDFLNKLDLTPVSEDSPDGYRVGEGFPKSGTEDVGVKPGDTIVAVNGYPVGEYHSDYLVWLSFKDQYRASVLVRTEDGDEFTFHFPDDVKGASRGTGG